MEDLNEAEIVAISVEAKHDFQKAITLMAKSRCFSPFARLIVYLAYFFVFLVRNLFDNQLLI